MTLADLLARFATVETQADGYLVECPSHADSKPSLRLTVSDRGAVLLKCRAGCETPAVVEALGLTMHDLATMKAGDALPDTRASSQDTPASPAEVARLAVTLDGYADLYSATDEENLVRAYTRDRFGLTAEDATRLGLGFADDLGGGPRLVVPFRDVDGVARGYQARALAADAAVRWLGPRSPDGASWSRIGYFPGTSGWDEVLVCEGPGDALTAAGLGYDAVGIRGAGLASNATVVDELATIVGTREAIIAGDGDPSGRRFSALLAEGLANRGIRVKVLALPDGLDLTDWRRDAAPGTFARDVIRAIAAAKPVASREAALLAWDEERYSLTDLGGARYLRDFIEAGGSGVRYAEETGFYLLDGGVWRRDERQGVRTHAQAVADRLRELAREASFAGKADGAGEGDKARASRLNRYAAHAQTTRGLDAMLRELQAVHGVPASVEDFDRRPDLLAFANGVVDLRTGTLRPHDAALLLTKRIEFDFDPDAKAPRWEEFLDEVFPKYPALPGYMRRLIGYGITGHVDEQCFGVFVGGGANGKSVLTDTLSEVFRDLTVTTPFSTFEDRASGGIPNDLAALKGARLVMASEGEAGRPMAEAVLKRVTGRDLIAARFMRKEFFEFRPTFLLLLASNFKPSFKGQDDGLWRRVKLIPFERFFKPEERDHRLGEKLLDERAGIAAWAIRGAREWFAQGLQDPPVVQEQTKNYREGSDILDGFIPGVFVAEEGAQVEQPAVFKAFQAYADEHNHLDLKRWSSRALYQALDERKFVRKRSTGGKWVVLGLRRSRYSDSVETNSDELRAEDESPAYSSPVPTVTTPTGADLDSVL